MHYDCNPDNKPTLVEDLVRTERAMYEYITEPEKVSGRFLRVLQLFSGIILTTAAALLMLLPGLHDFRSTLGFGIALRVLCTAAIFVPLIRVILKAGIPTIILCVLTAAVPWVELFRPDLLPLTTLSHTVLFLLFMLFLLIPDDYSRVCCGVGLLYTAFRFCWFNMTRITPINPDGMLIPAAIAAVVPGVIALIYLLCSKKTATVLKVCLPILLFLICVMLFQHIGFVANYALDSSEPKTYAVEVEGVGDYLYVTIDDRPVKLRVSVARSALQQSGDEIEVFYRQGYFGRDYYMIGEYEKPAEMSSSALSPSDAQ